MPLKRRVGRVLDMERMGVIKNGDLMTGQAEMNEQIWSSVVVNVVPEPRLPPLDVTTRKLKDGVMLCAVARAKC